MSRLKFSDMQVDKGVSQLVQNINKRGPRTKVTTGLITSNDVKPGEFIFTSIKKGQEGPASPTTDESRIYFKDEDGNLFQFTGTKVS